MTLLLQRSAFHLSLKMNVNIYLVSSWKIVTTIHWCVGFCWWQQVNCILPVSYCWCVMTNITLSETFALLSFLTTCLIKKSAERVKKAHSLTNTRTPCLSSCGRCLKIQLSCKLKKQISFSRPWGAGKAVKCGEALDCRELIRGSVSLLACG